MPRAHYPSNSALATDPSATIITGTASNMTGAAVLTSTVIDAGNLDCLSFAMVWTGTPTGTFRFEGSLDQSTWFDISAEISPAVTNPAGSASSQKVDITITGMPFYRVKYTNSASTGTLTVKAWGKGMA